MYDDTTSFDAVRVTILVYGNTFGDLTFCPTSDWEECFVHHCLIVDHFDTRLLLQPSFIGAAWMDICVSFDKSAQAS